MKRFKQNLDEMQEEKLLKIEHFGLWIAFWGLFAAMIIQMIFGGEPKQMAGEVIVFLSVSLYLLVACLKNGIWDRYLKANLKTNLLVSIFASVVVAFISVITNLRQGIALSYLPLTVGMIAVSTFLLCLAALQLSATIYRKRHEKLENDAEKDGETI